LGFTLDAIKQVRQELAGRVPLIGFSGAPFTLASYAIEGGSSKTYRLTKSMMYQEPATWHRLMEKLATVISDYLQAQVAAGAQALQLFDSWVGALSPVDYQTYVQPYSRQVIEMVKAGTNVPVIHFGTGTAGILPQLKAAGGDVIGVDWRVDLAEAWARLGDDVAVQGNLDPLVLFGPVAEIERQTARILDSVRDRPGHIFNLGHGILKQTPVENVAALIDFVHRYTK
ncbi:MAG: uroporphyrinogen decarboxylase family protein, partial [Anaerolineae bacterium]|nr:uroporphyrinogen decarboxylase family protein [Anaerolineae bacterium]